MLEGVLPQIYTNPHKSIMRCGVGSLRELAEEQLSIKTLWAHANTIDLCRCVKICGYGFTPEPATSANQPGG